MNPNKIKRTRRLEIPETNSSSSHTLTIFNGNFLTRDYIKQIPDLISDDGKTITIPGGAQYEFGRNNDDYNDLVSKLQYVTANIDYTPERKVLLEKVLKDYLGVENVIYDWYDGVKVDEWYDANPDKEDCPYYKRPDGTSFPCPNEVDHESYDLIDNNICESEDSLRDFLFSPNSWIFCGECEVTKPEEKFPNLKSTGDGIFFTLDPQERNADPEGKIGKIDINLFNNFPYDLVALTETSENSYYITNKEYKPWYKVDLPEEEDDPSYRTDELNKLSELWILRDNTTGKLTMNIGNIKGAINIASDVNSKFEVYVPSIVPEVFHYPFVLNFISINEFAEKLKIIKKVSVAGIPKSIQFTLKLSSPDIKIDEYV